MATQPLPFSILLASLQPIMKGTAKTCHPTIQVCHHSRKLLHGLLWPTWVTFNCNTRKFESFWSESFVHVMMTIMMVDHDGGS